MSFQPSNLYRSEQEVYRNGVLRLIISCGRGMGDRVKLRTPRLLPSSR